MPTIRIPVWIRSEYVTIVSPPFYKDQGARSAPDLVRGTNRLPFIGSTTNREYHRIRQNTRSRRSRLGRYLFCRRRPLKGRQNRRRPDFSGFMRVCGLFESEFSSTLHRRCPNPEIRYFSLCGAFRPFFRAKRLRFFAF